jgi:hypothetical protein
MRMVTPGRKRNSRSHSRFSPAQGAPAGAVSRQVLASGKRPDMVLDGIAAGARRFGGWRDRHEVTQSAHLRGRLKLSDDAALHCAVVTFVFRARCRKRSAVETGVSHPVQPKKLPVEVLIRCARALDLERPQEQLTVRTIPQGMRFYHSHPRIVPE